MEKPIAAVVHTTHQSCGHWTQPAAVLVHFYFEDACSAG